MIDVESQMYADLLSLLESYYIVPYRDDVLICNPNNKGVSQ